jgi:drug/metabolite transporter (DMT)-like permease
VLDTVLLALAASLCWGTADFTAGLKARKVGLPVVLAVTQGIGLVASLAIVAAAPRLPAAGPAIASLGAGVAVIGGLACFYRALAVGTMSVVAPIAATGVGIPVAVGLLGGDHLAPVQVLGMLAAVCGVVLASRHPGEDPTAADRRAHRNVVLLALASAAAFGSYFLLAHIGARGGVGWLLALAHITSVGGVLAFGLLAGTAWGVPALRDLRMLAAAGALDFGATALYGIANRHGQLSIVAVAGSLYPVATVLLARAVLAEHVTRIQGLGVALALLGVALIAA